MTNAEAVNWLINITADIGKAEHSDLWHYEQALSEIREMLEDAQPQRIKGRWERTKANSGYNAEWTCSNCGYTVYAEFCNLNFCSLCGAEMRGDEDGNE